MKTFQKEIDAAHPESSSDPRAMPAYSLAQKLVGERHSKSDLVALITWLIMRQPKGLLEKQPVPDVAFDELLLADMTWAHNRLDHILYCIVNPSSAQGQLGLDETAEWLKERLPEIRARYGFTETWPDRKKEPKKPKKKHDRRT